MSDFMIATSDREYFWNALPSRQIFSKVKHYQIPAIWYAPMNTPLVNYLSLTVSLSLLRQRSKAFTWQNTWFYILPAMGTSHAIFLSFLPTSLPPSRTGWFWEHSICHVVSCNLYPFTWYDLTWVPIVINFSLAFMPAVPFPFTQRYRVQTLVVQPVNFLLHEDL